VTEFNSLDVVQLTTTKNVEFMSGPKGQTPNPNYYWSIVGFIDGQAILSKEGTIIKAPMSDIRRVGESGVDHVMKRLAAVNKTNYIDVVNHVSQMLEISPTRIKSIIRRYHIPNRATDQNQLERITDRVKEILEASGGM